MCKGLVHQLYLQILSESALVCPIGADLHCGQGLCCSLCLRLTLGPQPCNRCGFVLLLLPAGTELKGVPNNVEFLRRLVRDPRFIAGDTTTKFLEGFSFTPRVAEVILPGETHGHTVLPHANQHEASMAALRCWLTIATYNGHPLSPWWVDHTAPVRPARHLCAAVVLWLLVADLASGVLLVRWPVCQLAGHVL